MNVKVEVEEQESWRRILTIEVPAEDVEKEYQQVAARVAKKVKLPGFRKGKVPATVVRKSFKGELDQEFLETVVPRAFGRALDETGIDPVSEPKFEELSFGEGRPLSFKADFDARPEFEIQGLTGLTADKEVPEVADAQVDEVVERFRKGHGELEEVDREAIQGDVLLLDYQAVEDDGTPIPGRQVKDYVLELGAGRVVEAFEETVAGATPGATRFAEVPYPEDYHDKTLAGTTARYEITVRKVQERRFPELTDALVAEKTDLKDIEELRGKIREEIVLEADRGAVERLERALLEKVVDANPFDAPQALVAGLLDDFAQQRRSEAQYQGEDPDAVNVEELKSANRDGAERQVRRMLVLDAIARREEIQVADEELRERVMQMAMMQGVQPRKLIEEFGGDRFLRRLSREIRDKKVLAFLVENAEITTKTVPAAPGQEGS
ncbi:trigger factor [bacterium]|nr:trigger factor [bacterium]